MKAVILLLAIVCLSACSHYRERFTYLGSDGRTNHVVDVQYRTFLIFGQAAALKTETQTSEFIRTVNGVGLLSKPDSESVKAITEGITSAIIDGIKKSGGIP